MTEAAGRGGGIGKDDGQDGIDGGKDDGQDGIDGMERDG